MIHHVIAHVVAELNSYLELRSPGDPDRVEAGSLLELDGKPTQGLKNKVVVSLINVEQDPVYHRVDQYIKRPDGTAERVRPETTINFYVLFAANLKKYDEALKAVANIVAFFHQRGSWSYADIAGLQDRKGRFSLELFNTSFEKLNHLWGALGAKYLPSVIYKIGLVDVRDTQIEALVPPVQEVWTNV